MRAWLGRLLACLLGLTAAMILVELGLRVFVPQPKSWPEIYRVLPEPLSYGLAPNASSLVDTHETRWHACTDGAGFRVASPGRQPPDLPQVLVLGDSFAFGFGVDYEQSFVGMLNALPDAPAWFVNAGVAGYGPTQYRLVLERQLAGGQPPRAVIAVSYLGNDFQDCVWDKHTPVKDGALGETGSMRDLLKRHLHAYRLFAKAWHAWNPTRKTLQFQQAFDPRSWTEPFFVSARGTYREEFQRMAAACRARSIPFLVVLIPPREAVGAAGEPEGGPHFELPVTMARETLQELDIACIDTTPALAQLGAERAYFAIDGHLTPAAHQLVRDRIRDGGRQLLGWP
jgi:hypothetical protein